MPSVISPNTQIWKSSISTYLFRSFSCWEELRKKDLQKTHDVRYQQYTPLGKRVLQGTEKLSIPHVIFKVMDYNILSQTHMQTHIRHYKKCPRECLNWSFRKNLLRNEFDAENADILCLQEVEEKYKNEILEPFRKKGFDAIFVPRGEGNPDGCALVYRTSMFRVEDLSAVHFKRPEVSLMDRPNVGLVARLGLRAHPSHSVVVANTHLLYNPRREDIRLCQLQMLLAETERLAYIPKGGSSQRYHPVVLTGDLNVRPNSKIIRLLRSKYLDKQQVDEVLPGVEAVREQLNISESCQYLDVLEARWKKQPDSRATKDLQKTLAQLRIGPELSSEDGANQPNTVQMPGTPPWTNKTEVEKYKQPSYTKRTPSGSINHVFNFENVYFNLLLDNCYNTKPLDPRDKIFKVNDYMFYSWDKNRHMKSGQLQLLSRLRLPSVVEYKSHFPFMPNHASGSDHFPLTANFLLTV